MYKIKTGLLIIGLLIYFLGGLYLIGALTEAMKHYK